MKACIKMCGRSKGINVIEPIKRAAKTLHQRKGFIQTFHMIPVFGHSRYRFIGVELGFEGENLVPIVSVCLKLENGELRVCTYVDARMP